MRRPVIRLGTWAGLRLLGVNGVVSRTPDPHGNLALYYSASNQHDDAYFSQVRMGCQMDLTSPVLIGGTFENYRSNEMNLAKQIIKIAMDYSLKLWQQIGIERVQSFSAFGALGCGRKMVEMSRHCPGICPCEMSLSTCT